MAADAEKPAVADGDLLPCPFCGGAAEFERRGTGRQSCIVACTDCGCRLETSETWNSGLAWNIRVTPKED